MDHEKVISLSEVCTHYKVEVTFIRTLGDYGLIQIIEQENEAFVDAEALAELETILHLHYDLEINLEGIDAISHLLKKVREMQRELTLLRNKLG